MPNKQGKQLPDVFYCNFVLSRSCKIPSMVNSILPLILAARFSTVLAQCPFGHGGDVPGHDAIKRSDDGSSAGTDESLARFTVNDTSEDYLTSDVGGPIEDQNSLKAGERGPTLLEDFIFRQKIMSFY